MSFSFLIKLTGLTSLLVPKNARPKPGTRRGTMNVRRLKCETRGANQNGLSKTAENPKQEIALTTKKADAPKASYYKRLERVH